VKYTYILVSGLMADRGRLSTELSSAFKAIWKCTAPSKVLGFAWLILLDRIPTKANLFRRKIINNAEDRVCVLCGNGEENLVHLFVYCPFAIQVWARIFCWLRMISSFLCFPSELVCGRTRE
jgi:hypothetical protein